MEYLVSTVLSCSSLSEDLYVKYEYCKINGRLGCRSRDFLTQPFEEFITVNTMYSNLTGKANLADYLMYLGSAKERLAYLLFLVDSYGINAERYKKYLNVLMQVDLLILNTDRHVHNYGIIYNSATDTFRLPPIFDNGNALDTDRSKNFISCTLSGSFEDQVTAFSFPVKPCFKIDYKRVYAELLKISRRYGNLYETKVLDSQLKKYKHLFS